MQCKDIYKFDKKEKNQTKWDTMSDLKNTINQQETRAMLKKRKKRN
jgi:hypothetical protein